MTSTELLVKTLREIESDEMREKLSSQLLDFMLGKLLIAQAKGEKL